MGFVLKIELLGNEPGPTRVLSTASPQYVQCFVSNNPVMQGIENDAV